MASVNEMTSAQLVPSLLETEDQREQWEFAKSIFTNPNTQAQYRSLAASFAQSCAGKTGHQDEDLFTSEYRSKPYSALGLEEDAFRSLLSLRDTIRDNNPIRGQRGKADLFAGHLGKELGVPELVGRAIKYDPGDPSARTQQSGVKPEEPPFVTRYLPDTEMSKWTNTAKTLSKIYENCRRKKFSTQKAAIGDLVDAWSAESLSMKPKKPSSQVWEEKKDLLNSVSVSAQMYTDLSAISSVLQSTFADQDWDTRDRKEYSGRLRSDLINSSTVNFVQRALVGSLGADKGGDEFNTVESLVSKLIDLKKNQDDQTAATKLDNIVAMFAAAGTGRTDRNTPTDYWKKYQSLFTDKVGLSEETFNELSTMTDTLRSAFQGPTESLRDPACSWLSDQIRDTRSRKIKVAETKDTDARQTRGKEPKPDKKQPVQNPIKGLLTADEYSSFKSVANAFSTARRKTREDQNAQVRIQKLNDKFREHSFEQGPEDSTAINDYFLSRQKHFESYGITQDTVTETVTLANTLRQHFDGKDKETCQTVSEWTKNALHGGLMGVKPTAPTKTDGDATKAKPTATDNKNAETAVGGETSATDAPAKAARRERGRARRRETDASKLDTTLAKPTTQIVELTEEEASALKTGTTEAPQTTVIDTHTEPTRLPDTTKRGAPEETTVPPPATKKARAPPPRSPPPRTTGDETTTTQRHMTYVSTDPQTPYVSTAPQPAYQTTTTAAPAPQTTEADGDTVMRDDTERKSRGPFPYDVKTAASQFATKTRALFRTRMRDWGGVTVDDDGDQGAMAWTGEKITFRAQKADLTYVEEYEHDGKDFRMTCGTTRNGEVVWQKDHDWDVKTGTLKCDRDWELDSRSPDAKASAAEQYKDFERIVQKTGLSAAQFQRPFKMQGDQLFQNGDVDFAKLPWQVIEALRDQAA